MCLHRIYELFVQRMKYNEKTEKESILNVCLVESTALLPSGLTDDQSNQIYNWGEPWEPFSYDKDASYINIIQGYVWWVIR